MVFTINIGLGDKEDIIEEEIAKVLQVVTFPVFYAGIEVLDSQFIFGSSLGLVYFIGDAAGSIDALLQLFEMRV